MTTAAMAAALSVGAADAESYPSTTLRLLSKQAVIEEFGACLVKYSPERSRRLLTLPVGSREEERLADEIGQANSGCVISTSSLSLNVGALRGAVALSLLNRDAAARDAIARRPAATPVRATAREGRALIDGFAGCLADAEPVKALALIETPLSSVAENNAVVAFGDALSGCIPEGVEYKLDIVDLRNHLAARLYQSAVARKVADAHAPGNL